MGSSAAFAVLFSPPVNLPFFQAAREQHGVSRWRRRCSTEDLSGAIRANPLPSFFSSESTSGNPLPSAFRQPEPGSRPEKFTVPSSKASDVAQNPYYKRDFRRNYPKTEFVTQDELAKLLIAQGGFESCVSFPTISPFLEQD
jgi:hypothetical protein